MKKENLLTLLILLGLVAGVLFGQFVLYDSEATAEALRDRAAVYQQWGELVFIRPLMMLIIPMVFLSVVTGVTSIGNPSRLGIIGGATVTYFVATTLLATMLGLAIVTTVAPGAGVSPDLFATAQQEYAAEVESKVESGPSGVGGAFLSVLQQMVPVNLVRAAAEMNILGIVVFAMLLGVALATVGKAAAPAVSTLESLFNGVMRIVSWVIWLAPVGVFLIVAARVGIAGLGKLIGPLGLYIVCVIVGLAIHGAIVLPLILWVFGRVQPYRFLWQMRRVILTAFSTASSSATLPVTIEECRTAGGCSKRAATFVPALGATINMNGTALYEVVAVVFLFQMFGYDLTLTQQLVILITALLAAVGAPGIPSAGLVTMAIVINAVNSTLAADASTPDPLPLWTIAIIYGVDRFLDMCRTVINVLGDAIGARIITRIAPDAEEEKEAAFA